jgi:hypothetical protein
MIIQGKSLIHAVLVLVGFTFMLTVNILANALPINGVTTGSVSKVLPNLFTPAGFTFSIWFVIYVLLALFTIWSLRAALTGRGESRELLPKLAPLFFLSSLANGAWLLAWHHMEIGLALVLMIVILASLIGMYLRARLGLVRYTGWNYWAVRIPISVYLGWISVATIANVTAFLVSTGWRGGPVPEPIWAALMAGVAVVLGVLMLARRNDIAFTLVVIWALYGIMIKRVSLDPQATVAVIIVSGGGMIILAMAISLRFILGRR